MIGLFLDDERNPEDVSWLNYPDGIEWFVVRRMSDFMFAILNSDNIDIISFDHDLQDFDLNGVEATGYDCLQWLIGFHMDNADSMQLPLCLFHTKNVIGEKNMGSYYSNYLKHLSH